MLKIQTRHKSPSAKIARPMLLKPILKTRMLFFNKSSNLYIIAFIDDIYTDLKDTVRFYKVKVFCTFKDFDDMTDAFAFNNKLHRLLISQSGRESRPLSESLSCGTIFNTKNAVEHILTSVDTEILGLCFGIFRDAYFVPMSVKDKCLCESSSEPIYYS